MIIKELLLPSTIGNYYVWSKLIAAVEIRKTHISACLMKLSGNKRIIKELIDIPIEVGPVTTTKERTIAALTTVKERLGSYDELISILPSNLAITKELKFPLEDREQIALVIGFEMEPLLPFARNDTMMDFLITKSIPQEKSAEVLVAAIQKNHIDEHLALYKAVNMVPQKITLDTFILYTIYQAIPAYHQDNGISIIIDIGLNHTQVAYLIDHQIKTIRSLNHGIAFIAKTLSTLLNQNGTQAMDYLMRYGLEVSQSQTTLEGTKKAIDALWQEISFTLDIFTQKTKQAAIAKILFTGIATQINGFIQYIGETTGIPCTELAGADFLEKNGIMSSQKVTSGTLTALTATLPIDNRYDCNFLTSGAVVNETYKNIITFLTPLSISLISLILLFSVTQLQLNNLNNELFENEQEIIQELRSAFPTINEDDTSLEELMIAVEQVVSREENTWFVFSGASRRSFLTYLLELTTYIDKVATGFEPHSITINEKQLTINASVKSYQALRTFEQNLRRSKLFKNIEEQQNYANFTMKITLAPQDR